MYFLAEPLHEEYLRWVDIIGEEDPYATQNTMGIHDVLRAHFLIIDYFYNEKDLEGVGGIGPKNIDSLHSALYRQFMGFDGKEKWNNDFQRCATLMFGLIKDHPFHDANKRTAFLVSLYFLHKMGRLPEVQQKEFEDFTVDIAEDNLKRFRRFKDLRKTGDDPEILFIADFLRRKSRESDSRYYTVPIES
ncbi:MAG: type II toxin-antitoxin system death-on-curing family toxin [Gammaproteobacteria bacterium]|nr:type II toxin-antitoxin system death-on-curing family toxin [Gammaproteobacteria bacterium]